MNWVRLSYLNGVSSIERAYRESVRAFEAEGARSGERWSGCGRSLTLMQMMKKPETMLNILERSRCNQSNQSKRFAKPSPSSCITIGNSEPAST